MVCPARALFYFLLNFFTKKHDMCSIPSHIAMKEKPRKSPRVPPTSATKEDKPYNSSSVSTRVKGEVFHSNNPQSP